MKKISELVMWVLFFSSLVGLGFRFTAGVLSFFGFSKILTGVFA